jgi:hypothetical protein
MTMGWMNLATTIMLKPHAMAPAASASHGAGIIGALFGVVFGLIGLVVALVMVASMWKIFTKAGEAGWMSLVPILNLLILLKITGKPVIWILFMCIPLVNMVFAFLLAVELAKVFGQGTGFALGMLFVPFVFYPMLGFGSATYLGPARA